MSAPKKKVERDQFKFVNYASPSDARKRQARTQVRSHVTRWQHRHSRAQPQNTTQSKVVAPDREADVGTVDANECLSYASNANRPADVVDPPSRPEPRESREASYEEDDCSRRDNDECATEATLFTPEACRLASEGVIKSFSQAAMSFRTVALQDSQNIIGMGLKDMQLELSRVMGLYKNICETQAVDFARQYDIGGDQASWGRFCASCTQTLSSSPLPSC